MTLPYRRPSLVLLLTLAVALTACPEPPTPELETTPVGVIIGEVFIEDPGRVSVADATVQLLGSSYLLTTEADRQFAIPAVPVGEHVLMIEHAPSGRAARVPVTVSQAFQTVQLDEDATTLKRAASVHGTVSNIDETDGAVVAFLVGGTTGQITLVADDGSFTLGPVPAGASRIAVSATGFAPTIVDADLEEGENTIDAAFTLEQAGGGVSVTGLARMIDRPTHEAVVVKLNNGQFITTTDADGNYAFAGVPPGRYEVRAEQAGYAPAVLGQVAVSGNGQVEGSYDLWLSPGQENPNTPDVLVPDGGLPAGSTLTVDVGTSIGTEAPIEELVPLQFNVNVNGAGDVIPTVSWSVTPPGGGADPYCGATPCTQTSLLLNDLTEGIWTVSVSVSAGGPPVTVSKSVTVIRTLIDVVMLQPTATGPVEPGSLLSLEADVTVRAGVTAEVTWSDAGCDEVGNVIATGSTGTMLVPEDGTSITVSVLAAAGAGSACAERTLLLTPPVEVESLVESLGGASIAGVNWDPVALESGLLELVIEEGHPVDLVANVPTEFDVTWSTDTGVNATGVRFNLSQLGVDQGGTTVTMTATSMDGVVVTREATVTVLPLTFTITLIAPVASTTYLVENGLPLAATVSHGWQTTFPTVSWTDEFGAQLATSLSANVVRGPGAGNVLLTVTDVAGNVAQATVGYTMADVGFGVTLASPSNGAVYELGDPITLRASVAHALVTSGAKTEADFATTYRIDGVSMGNLAWNTDVPLPALTAGTHTIRVTAQEQTPIRFASAEVVVTVNAPEVVTLIRASPGGDAIDLTTFSPPPALTYLVSGPAVGYRWYLDGQEFDASWFGYGSDPTSPSRADLTLPAYDPAAAPWTDPRWSEGSHLVEFCATTNAAEPRQVCASFTATTYAAYTTSSTNIAAGQVETWSGAVYVTGRRYVGGTLIVTPGTKVFFAPDGGFVTEDGGTLLIGQLGAARVKVAGINASPGQRNAIGAPNGACLYPQQMSTTVVESATFEGCQAAVSGNAQTIDPAATYTLRDVVFRHGVDAVIGMCPTMEDVTFADFNRGLAETDRNGWGRCADGRVYEGITFDGVDNVAMEVSAANGAVTVRNVTVNDAGVAFGFSGTSSGAAFDDGPVTFEHNVVTGGGTGVGIRTEDSEQSPIVLRGNHFSDLNVAFEMTGTQSGFDDEGDVTLLGNRVDDVNEVFEIRHGRNGGQVIARGNTFVDYGTLVDLTITTGPSNAWRETLLQGNYLGAFDDPGQAAYEQVTGTVGRSLPSSFTEDTWDDSNTNRIVRLDNPLDTPFVAVAPPLAVVTAPDQSYRYHKDVCVPLEATAIANGADTGDCIFETFDPDDPGGGRVLLEADTDGCVENVDVLVDGQNWLEMTCDDGARTTTHRVRFYAARDRLSGPVRRANGTLDVDVTLTSDLIVPLGHALTVAPGVEILMANTDERRSRRTDILTSTHRLTDSRLVDIRVEGTLAFAGTAVDPIVVRPADGLSGKATWGDVVAIGPTATLTYDHVRVEGARGVLTAIEGLGPVSFPRLEARFLDVEDVEVVAMRHCPAVFEDVTITNASSVLRLGNGASASGARCAEPLTLRRVSAVELSDIAIAVDPYPGEPAGIIHIIDSDFSFGTASHFLDLSAMSAVLDGVTITNTNWVTVHDQGTSGRTLTIVDSMIDGFTLVHDDPSSAIDVDVVLDHSVFTNGQQLVESGRTETTMSDCRVENVDEPFLMHRPPTGSTSLTVTGSSIEGAETFLQVDNSGIAGLMSVTGNNFSNTQFSVANVDDGVNDSVVLDFTGNYWGVGTDVEIEALIAEQNPDADPNDDIKGLVDYSGYSATPLSLPNLP